MSQGHPCSFDDIVSATSVAMRRTGPSAGAEMPLARVVGGGSFQLDCRMPTNTANRSRPTAICDPLATVLSASSNARAVGGAGRLGLALRGMELFSEIWAAPHMSDLLPPGLGRGKMHVAVRSWLVLCTLIGCCGASGNVVFKADGPPSADLVNAAMPPHGQECHDIVNIKSDLTDQASCAPLPWHCLGSDVALEELA